MSAVASALATHRAMRRNVRLFYAYAFLLSSWYFLPFIVPFYREKGLGFLEITLTQGVYYFAKSTTEIPTGAVADRVSRRASMVVGSILFAAGSGVIAIAPGLAVVLLGEVLRGTAASFVSGSDSALLYDYLKARGAQGDFVRVQGRARSIGTLGGVASTAIGGLVAPYGLVHGYFLAAASMLVAAVVASRLAEADHTSAARREGRFATSYRAHLAAAFQCLKARPNLGSLFAFSAMLYLGDRLAFWFSQPFLEVAGVGVDRTGLLFSAFFAVSALASWAAAPIHTRLGERGALALSAGLVLVTLVAMSASPAPILLGLLYARSVGTGVGEPCLLAAMNDEVDPSIRATVLSLSSQADNLAFALLFPVLGASVDRAGLSGPMGAVAALFGAITLVLVVGRARASTPTSRTC